MQETGQAFTVFRFLVAIITGLAVLLIIFSIIKFFEEREFEISRERFFEGFRSAFNSPNGDVFEREDIAFNAADLVTAISLARDVKIPADCVEFSGGSSAFSLQGTQAIEFQEKATINVFYRCFKSFSAACETSCEVSFGQPFR